jgi:hypothetical protein
MLNGRFGALSLLLSLLACLLLPGFAAAQSEDSRPQNTQPERSRPLARIDLADMSPRVITGASAPVLRVTGRVVNVGDRPITKLGVRLQRDEPLASDYAALAAVDQAPEAPHVTRFSPLRNDLGPGQSTPFELDVPLRGGAELESLQISEPGVYPLLVNLNGKPDFGGTARLASVPLLLPVLGLPPAGRGAPPGPAVQRPAKPVPFTVVWPLAAQPARVPTAPGEPITIRSTDAKTDPMATELAPGGRLDGLLGALEQVVPPGSPLAGSVCVAVDPLLLETVNGMIGGYRVAHPAGISQGSGAQDARSWLDRLRRVVQGRCVLPLPYADPDMVALSRGGLTELEALATATGVRLVTDLLQVQPLTGISWPAGGMLDERTLADLTALKYKDVLLEPRAISSETPADDVVGLAGGGGSDETTAGGLIMDPLLTSALSPGALSGQDTQSLGGASGGALATTASDASDGNTVATSPADTPGAMAAQDALGALTFRAAFDPTPGAVLMAPPHRWQASGKEATALLRTARELVESGFLVPRALPALADAPPAGPAVAVSYPPQAAAAQIPADVTANAKRALDVLRDLQASTVRDATANLEPADLLDPLRLGLLRGVSSAWRGQPSRAEQTSDEVRRQLDELRYAVRIVPSPGPYTLASSDSPLLITVSNGLPLGVQVQLSISQTAGLRAGGVGLQLVPARSTRQFVIPAEVSRAGPFSVNAGLSTPAGTPLGQPSTLQLRSTAFGTITIALTAGAGAVLVVLVGRRILRRVRRRETQEAG